MMSSRRIAAALLATVVAATGLAAVASPASARSGTLPGAAAPMWQTNGTVNAILPVGNTVYVGGDFTAVRPPGAAPGTGEVARNRIAAFDATTGALVTSFNLNASASVWALSASPDGSRVYVGGDFTTLSGQSRSRLAAFTTSTGALTSWAPVANGRVRDIDASASTVYLGGSFSRIGTVTEPRVAAVSAATGASLTAFAAVADNVLYDVELSPAGDKLYLAGGFLSINGDPAQQVAAVVGSTNGELLPFPAAAAAIPRRTPECIVEMKDITVDADSVYYASEGTGGGCFDGLFAANDSDGSSKWTSRCLGATQGIAVLSGVLYVGSHAHDCTNDTGFDPDAFAEVGWARGLSRKLLARDTDTGALTSWYPNTNGGPAGGLGPRTMATDGTQLFVGGEFTSVNGVLQQGLTRFSPAASPVAVPDRPATPQVVARAGRAVSVFVQSPLDLDDTDLELRLYRSGTTAPIATADVHSLFWRRPVVSFEDTNLPAGATYTYSVEVKEKNGTGTSPRVASAAVTVRTDAAAYPAAVQADAPTFHWRLGETSGPVAADASAGLEPGTAAGTIAYRQAGATPDGNGGVRFDGATGYITSETAVPSPTSFTVEAWVNTQTTSGGRILGFGNSRGGLDFNANPVNSSNYDKQLYMTNDGRLVFGVYRDGVYQITTQGAFNDGQWHHVVGTQGPGGMTLYVDGVRRGRNGQTQNQGYTGFWRVGGDSLGGWPDQPASSYFAGTVDEVAVYPTALPQASVVAHYNATGRTAAVPPSPSDPYGASVVADGPSYFWRLDDAAGSSTAADSSGNEQAGAITPVVTLGVDGATGAGSRAGRFSGGSAGVASTTPESPTTYGTELWFRTTTATGGKLIGFGNAASGTSSAYDKHVYMTDDGHLAFGVYLGSFELLTTPGTYDDGQWHQVVAGQGPEGMTLYVDGALVASNSTSANQQYPGFWRVGGDNLGAWPQRPSTDWFTGDIDEVSVYSTPLTAARVDAHYRATGRTGPPDSVPPTVQVTAPTAGAAVFGPVTLAADAADDRGVASVTFLVDGTAVGTDTSAPFSTSWSAVQEGSRSITAVATDTAGLSTTSSPVVVTVPADTSAPSGVTGLAATAVTATTVTLGWSPASDDRGVSGYVVSRDGVPLAGQVASTSLTDTGLAPGTEHTYTVRAVDAAGNTGPPSPGLTVTTASSEPVLFTDAWSRPDASGWGAPWSSSTGAGGSVSTVSGTGRLSYTDTAGAFARVALDGTPETDSDVLLQYRWSDTTARSFFTVYLRGSGGWANAYRPRNGYGLELNSTSSTVTVQRSVDGAVTNLTNVAGAQLVTTQPQMLRLRVVGDRVQFRTWPASQPEPTTWASTITDTSVTAPGQVHLSLVRAGANVGAKFLELDDVTWTRRAV